MITSADLLTVVRETIREELSVRPPDPTEYLTLGQVAKEYRVGYKTMLRAIVGCPYVRVGESNRYRRDEVEEFFRAKTTTVSDARR